MRNAETHIFDSPVRQRCVSPLWPRWRWRCQPTRNGSGATPAARSHVSDTPPPRDIPSKDILQQPELVVRKPVAPPPAASAASAVAAKPSVDPALEERKRLAEQEQAARAKGEEQKAAAARQDNCRRAREQLATLDSGQRIARVKADGEREYLDDAARAQESQRARQVISSDCR